MSLQETRDRQGAFPRLSEDDIAALEERGTRRKVEVGDLLFKAGDDGYDFFAVLSGTVTILDDAGRADERIIGVHRAGRFLGELGLLTGEGAYLTAKVVDAATPMEAQACAGSQVAIVGGPTPLARPRCSCRAVCRRSR